jgi:hypothetical protein
MNPQTTDPSDQPLIMNNPLSVMQQEEQVICEIKRHPIGMLGMYVAGGGLLLVVAIMSLVTLQMAASVAIFVVVATIVTIFLLFVNKIYWGNRWIVTSDSITQIRQTSLFDKKSSQLSLANLEDITAEQDSMLAQMFHFGTISAETAAATDKFFLTYCPNPNEYARKILAAREHFDKNRRHDMGQQPQAQSIRSINYGMVGAEAVAAAKSPDDIPTA